MNLLQGLSQTLNPLIHVLNRKVCLLRARVGRSKRSAVGITIFHVEPGRPNQLEDESGEESEGLGDEEEAEEEEEEAMLMLLMDEEDGFMLDDDADSDDYYYDDDDSDFDDDDE